MRAAAARGPTPAGGAGPARPAGVHHPIVWDGLARGRLARHAGVAAAYGQRLRPSPPPVRLTGLDPLPGQCVLARLPPTSPTWQRGRATATGCRPRPDALPRPAPCWTSRRAPATCRLRRSLADTPDSRLLESHAPAPLKNRSRSPAFSDTSPPVAGGGSRALRVGARRRRLRQDRHRRPPVPEPPRTFSIAVVTNDIYTREAPKPCCARRYWPAERITAVETAPARTPPSARHLRNLESRG